MEKSWSYLISIDSRLISVPSSETRVKRSPISNLFISDFPLVLTKLI